jgi:hypothetical protein
MSSVPTRPRSPHDELEHAVADYLRISRGADQYASSEEHEAAEQAAWERLLGARAALEAGS